MRASLIRIWMIVRKESLQILRTRRMISVIVVMPILQLLLYGYVATTDLRSIRTVLLDSDRTQASRAVAERLGAGGFFSLGREAAREEDITAALDRGEATIGIVIPAAFSKTIERGERPAVQLVVDGTNSNTATLALNYATAILSTMRVGYAVRPAVRPGTIDARPRVWYNPELRSVFYMVPGVLCILLVQMLIPLSAANLVKEREAGTSEQLSVTPIRPYELIAGKIIPFLIVGYMAIAVIILTAVFWYEVPIRGSLLELLLYSGIFLVVILSIGLLISAVSRTQEQSLLTSAFIIMPNFILSGFLFPIESMPSVIQKITYLIPLRYFLVIVRSIFLKGTSFDILWPEVTALVALAILFTGMAVRKTAHGPES